MPITMPLLAGDFKKQEFHKIRYPVIASPKLDGIRCMKVDGKVVSRNFNEMENKFIAKDLAAIIPDGFDGEILLRKITREPRFNPIKHPEKYAKEVKEIAYYNKISPGKPYLIPFNYVSSEVTRHQGEPDYVFYVFDYVIGDGSQPYNQRIKTLQEAMDNIKSEKIIRVPTFIIDNEKDLFSLEEECVQEGFEGVMIRDPEGKYYTPRYIKKSAIGKRSDNRSNIEEGILLKIKRFQDSEAEIIGFQQAKTNQNEKELNVFGYSSRSSKKEGIELVDSCGALLCRDIYTGIEFKCANLKDVDADYFWTHQEEELGQIIKYRFQPAGVKEKPRFPRYQGKRATSDMS